MLVIALGKGSSVQRTKENIFGLSIHTNVNMITIHRHGNWFSCQLHSPNMFSFVRCTDDPFPKAITNMQNTSVRIHFQQLAGKPVSMTMDRDHIYVCVNGRTISLLHKDGRFIKNLINLELDGRRICYHESSNQLVVLTKAFWGVSHFIQIYQL
jgi:hypothetical protein